jgi:tetratricopeptide (TPR) repeat protein
MSRTSVVTLVTLAALIPFASGCGRDREETTSSTAGASPALVSGGSTDSSPTDPGTATTPPGSITYEQAESTYDSGKYPEAIQQFSLYTESRPENPWGHYMLGLSAWKAGERDRALTAFDRSLELDPTHRKSLFNSARVLLEMGRTEEALKRVESALAQEPMSDEGLRLLGRVRYQDGQVDAAIEAYRRALTVDQHDAWSMNNLGLIYIDQNRSEEALGPLARAVQLRPNAPVFHNNLGLALERAGYPMAAAKSYEAAISADSSYQKAAVSLSRVTALAEQKQSEAVDVEALAHQFAQELESRQASEQTTVETEVGDTLEGC